MQEFVGGCTSGIVQSVIGHPLDTIKVLIQTNRPLYKNPVYYYKGVTFPTTFNVFFTGWLFNIHSKLYYQMHSHYVAGACSGLILAPVVYYFDVGKIHYQVHPSTSLSWSHFKRVRGIGTTSLRESIATSIYMGVYFNMEERYGSLMSGGCAGLTSWLATYPLDVIKTRQMSKGNKCLSFHSAYKMGDLWKGFGVCAIRAVLVNAVGFWSYRKVMDMFT